jgi:hypothetical protein
MILFYSLLILVLANLAIYTGVKVSGKKIVNDRANALIKWGALVVDGRGKIGGTVFTKGRSGAVARNKVTPVNRRSSYQTAARNRLTTFSQAWRDLSQSQRDAWNAAVSDFTNTNVFGDTVQPTGKNLFTKLNINLALVGVSQISEPPTPAEIPAMTSITPTMANGAGTASLAFGPSPVPADTAFLIRSSVGLSPGREFISSQLKFIGYLDASDTTPEDFATIYQNRFGSIPAEGLKVFVEVVGINKVTGQAGTPLRASCVVAA